LSGLRQFDLKNFMRQFCFEVRRLIAVLVCLAGAVGLSGCANIPYIAGESPAINEQADRQTGSNLLRRDKASLVRELDKDALESTLRGTNANRDNGK